MNCSTFLMTAAISLAGTLAGCSGTMPVPQTHVATNDQPIKTVPVYVVPDCRMLAGKQYCSWFEPRGYKQYEPTQTSIKHVDGIAL